MDEETERMVALKKAYAEMILHTSKEAAARVMAADRTAHKLEQDLNSTKEEALQMLLRLKQIIDTRNTEAEATSLNQKRRIHELEAQLDEAEGVIIDLRAKLSQVEEQLEDVKSKYTHSLRPIENVDIPSQCWAPELDQSGFASLSSFSHLEPVPVTSEAQTSILEHSVLVPECLKSAKETAKPNSELDACPCPAHITKSEEPELYKNACTPANCSPETSLRDENLHPVQIVSLFKSKTLDKQNRRNANTILSSRADMLKVMCSFVKQAALRNSNTVKDQPAKVCKIHRRKTRYGKTKSTTCRYRSCHSVKSLRKSSTISRCKHQLHITRKVAKSGDTSSNTANVNEVEYASGLEEKLQHEKYQAVSVVPRSTRKRKFKHWDNLATSCRPQDPHSHQFEELCQNNKVVEGHVNKGKNLLEVQEGGEPKAGLHGKAAFANASRCANTEEVSHCVWDAAEKDFNLIDVPMLVEQNGLSLAPSDLRDSKTSEVNDKASSLPDCSKPLKYTFSRKRKKGSLISSNDNNSFGESLMKKRSEEENDVLLAPENSNLVDESPHGGRRLVQVARQLISLSSTRWW